MSKLYLDSKVPATYDKAVFASILRAVMNEVNPLAEGKIAGRYAAQVSMPTSVAAAVGDIVWDSNATVTRGSVRLGWICNVASLTAPTFQEIRVLNSSLEPPQAWAAVTVTSGVPSVTASYNVTSITDAGVGDFTVNYTNTITGGTGPVVGTADISGTANNHTVNIADRGATSHRAIIKTDAGAAADPVGFYVVAW